MDIVVDDNSHVGATGGSYLFNLQSGDTFRLTAGHTMSTGDFHLYLLNTYGSNVSITIEGTLQSLATPAINMGDNGESGNHVIVAETGTINLGPYGIWIWGSQSIVDNAGTISGGTEAIEKQYGSGSGAFTINNEATGTITSDGDAIAIGNTVKEKTVINNDGVIEGANAFSSLSSAVAEIHNLGTMTGDILFGKGNDIYDGALGTLLGTLNGGAGRDMLTTGKGNDQIIGGANRDVMTGGAGGDHFIFQHATDSFGTRSQTDLIKDFSHKQGDIIDLDLIDANTVKANDQDFAFVGTSSSAGKIGQLWYQIDGNTTYVYGNTDKDSDAEFALALTGKIKLEAGDFDL